MAHTHGQTDCKVCCNSDSNPEVRQTLSEMDFERGIWYAAQNNDLDRVQMLLKKSTAVDVQDLSGYTALHYAARNGHYKVCKTLLENGAFVNAQTRCGRATALHRAATQGRTEIVELLLKSGGNANLKDADGCTALHRSLVAQSVPVCKLLIPRTDLMTLNNNGDNIQHLAEQHCPDILPFLLTYLPDSKNSED